MKRFCARHGIPTAPFAVFDDPADAERHARGAPRPRVVMAAGLAAGMGVVVPVAAEVACAAIDRLMRGKEVGDAGAVVVLEERLEGEEASFHAVCDGRRAVALVAAQDHKRVGEGDRGPNTGGMGAYAPAADRHRPRRARARDARDRRARTLAGMAAEGRPFAGCSSVGLDDPGRRRASRSSSITSEFGDPGGHGARPPLRRRLVRASWTARRGAISSRVGGCSNRASGAAISVVMAARRVSVPSRGPGDRHRRARRSAPRRRIRASRRDLPAARWGRRDERRAGHSLVGARAESLELAAAIAYGAVARIRWEGEHHRRDVGHRARCCGRPGR